MLWGCCQETYNDFFKNVCRTESEPSVKREKKRKECPHNNDSVIERLPTRVSSLKGSPTLHWRHAATKPLPHGPLEDTQDTIHSLLTPSTLTSSPLKYRGSRGAQGTCAHLKHKLIFSFVNPPKTSTVAKERKGLAGRRNQVRHVVQGRVLGSTV